MLGAIIGDIVGSRFEFNNHRSTDFELFHKDCSFTDDTICTIAVAESCLYNTDFEDSLQIWCKKYPNPMGGYGGSFKKWIFSEHPEPYYSFGNGSAMRVSPVGWLKDDVFEVLQYASLSACITHDHPEGIKGAEVIATAIFMLRKGMEKEKLCSERNMKYFGYELNHNCNKLRKTVLFDETCMTAVPYAFQCLKESHDFESAIRLAVSIGGDSDTIAAITGSLAEACYGIPKWIEETAMTYLPEDMKQIINEFKTNCNGKLYNV